MKNSSTIFGRIKKSNFRKVSSKPRKLEDVVSSGRAGFSSRINLYSSGGKEFPFGLLFRGGVILASAWFLVLGSVSAPTSQTLAANPQNDANRVQLEQQLQDIENQINTYETQAGAYREQGKTLKGEIDNLNNQISRITLGIKADNLQIQEIGNQIGDIQAKVVDLEGSLQDHHQALADILKTLYEKQSASMAEVFLKTSTLSGFFDELNSLSLLQTNLNRVIAEIKDTRTSLESRQEDLALARSDAETARLSRESQKAEVDQLKQGKNQLLTLTKGQESKYQDLVVKRRQDAAKVRNQLFELLGGGELSFGDAYRFAKLAGDATGVRPAFILAVLDRESALGQNVGKCKYNEISPLTGKPAMSPDRDVPIFLALTSALNISPDSVTISCPNKDGTYGGAMGPAQFIPSTWNGYTSAISKVTGRMPTNPWNNGDAFVAAALYLKDAGAATNERNAAARYYCGARWNRYVCTQVYGRKVIESAAQFQSDINVLNS